MEYTSFNHIDDDFIKLKEKYRLMIKGLHFHLNDAGKELSEEIENKIIELQSGIRSFSMCMTKAKEKINKEFDDIRWRHIT